MAFSCVCYRTGKCLECNFEGTLCPVEVGRDAWHLCFPCFSAKAGSASCAVCHAEVGISCKSKDVRVICQDCILMLGKGTGERSRK
jgi:hypothetical protein